MTKFVARREERRIRVIEEQRRSSTDSLSALILASKSTKFSVFTTLTTSASGTELSRRPRGSYKLGSRSRKPNNPLESRLVERKKHHDVISRARSVVVTNALPTAGRLKRPLIVQRHTDIISAIAGRYVAVASVSARWWSIRCVQHTTAVTTALALIAPLSAAVTDMSLRDL